MKINKYLAIVLALATVIVIAGCAGNPQSAPAGTAQKNVTVGLSQFAPHPSLDNCREGFIEGMRQAGYEEGKNVTYDSQNAQADPAVAAQIANTFASKGYDLICAIATPAAAAAYNEGSRKNIPVIFTAVSDPVASELVQSIQKPNTGASGTSDILPVEEQLQFIRAMLPEAKVIGIMYTTSESNSLSNIKRYKELSPKYGFTIEEQGISSGSEVSMAADALLAKVDCVTNLTDNTVVTNMQIILDKAKTQNIPVFGSEEEQVKNGCIGAMGIDYFALGVETGKMAAKVLDGGDINTLAVMEFEASKPFLNKAVMDALGVKEPADIKDATYLG